MNESTTAPAVTMPAIGTRAVHKDDYANNVGPVWEVYGHKTEEQKVRLKAAERHKLNAGKSIIPKDIPVQEFKDDYRTL